MSRFYDMQITVDDLATQAEATAVCEALELVWDFEFTTYPRDSFPVTLYGGGQSSLRGGESEEEFAERCYRAVLCTLKHPAEIIVNCTYMENLPYEEYHCTEEDIARILGSCSSST